MVSGGESAGEAKVVLTHATCGRVIDLGIADTNNMGAAMAPAAAESLAAHFRDLKRGFADYDLIVTGDLGHLGRDLLIELLREKKIDVDERKLFDCGCEIFSERQDTHSGGSWHGATDCLKGGFTPVYTIDETGRDYDGNRALIMEHHVKPLDLEKSMRRQLGIKNRERRRTLCK